jgi:hypothetical protein
MLISKAAPEPLYELQQTVTIMQQRFQAVKAFQGAEGRRIAMQHGCRRITRNVPVAESLGNVWRIFATYAGA